MAERLAKDGVRNRHITLQEVIKKEFKTKKDKELFEKELYLARIAFKVSELRKKQRLSQKELAKRLHTKQQYISRIEQPDNTAITLNTLQKLAEVFHKSLVVDFV